MTLTNFPNYCTNQSDFFLSFSYIPYNDVLANSNGQEGLTRSGALSLSFLHAWMKEAANAQSCQSQTKMHLQCFGSTNQNTHHIYRNYSTHILTSLHTFIFIMLHTHTRTHSTHLLHWSRPTQCPYLTAHRGRIEALLQISWSAIPNLHLSIQSSNC